MDEPADARFVLELEAGDLVMGASPVDPRQFCARLDRVEPRITRKGLAWGVLTLFWSGHKLRGPMFATWWALSPELEVGSHYMVTGNVGFRDARPVIQVLRLRECQGPARLLTVER